MLDMLKKGLHQDNLLLLIKQCDASWKEDPITFFVLENIFKQLEGQYEGGQIPAEYHQEAQKLIPLIEKVLIAEGDSQKIQSLEKLITAVK